MTEPVDFQKLTKLVRAGLYDASKLTLLKRSLEKDAGKMTPIERENMISLLNKLLTQVLDDKTIFQKVRHNVSEMYGKGTLKSIRNAARKKEDHEKADRASRLINKVKKDAQRRQTRLMKEDSINEISDKTVRSYLDKSNKQYQGYIEKFGKAQREDDKETYNSTLTKMQKRDRGLNLTDRRRRRIKKLSPQNEAYINDIKKSEGKDINYHVGQKYSDKELKWRGFKHISSMKDHDIYHSKENGYSTYIARNKKTGVNDISLRGDEKERRSRPSTIEDLYLAGHKGSTLKAHDFYDHLIKKHNKILVGDNQSVGAQKVWQKLAQKRGVNIHGWKDNKPVNLNPHDPDETHSEEGYDPMFNRYNKPKNTHGDQASDDGDFSDERLNKKHHRALRDADWEISKRQLVASKGRRFKDDREKLGESSVLDRKTLSVEELADKWNVSVERINKELAKGIKVEKEHTSNEKVASEIARDHIRERLDYYTRLKRVDEENIQEISPGLAKRYIDRSWGDATSYERAAARSETSNPEKSKNYYRKMSNRDVGFDRAVKRTSVKKPSLIKRIGKKLGLTNEAVSTKQQHAAGAALATQRGEYDGGKKHGAINRMSLMKTKDLEKLATTHPKKKVVKEEDLHELHGKGDLEKIRDYHSDKAIQYYGRASTMRKNKGSFEKSQSLDNVGKAHSSQNARARYNIQKLDEKKVVKEGTSKADNQWGWDPGREQAPEHRGLEDQNRDYYKRKKLEAKERAKKLAAKRREEPNLPFGKPLKRFAAGTYKLKEEDLHELHEGYVSVTFPDGSTRSYGDRTRLQFQPRETNTMMEHDTTDWTKARGHILDIQKELVERYNNLQELTKDTLKSYVKKSSKDAANHTASWALDNDSSHDKKIEKREKGMSKALDKLGNPHYGWDSHMSKKGWLSKRTKERNFEKSGKGWEGYTEPGKASPTTGPRGYQG